MGRTVLIVEDDKSVARLLADVLEGEGYQVLTESDGEWGLRTFQHKDVHLIISDVLLPKLMGFDLVEQLRALEKGKTVPIVLLSGVYRASAHQDKLIERHGIRAYFDKPVDIDRLLDVVRAALPLTSAARPREASSTQRTQPVDGRLLSRVTMRIDMNAELGMAPELDAALRIANLPVPRRGDLEELPFARLLGQLYAARATGALMLRRSQVKKIVYLRQGVPIFVKSNMLGECLGHVMVRERLISRAQCDRSVERLKEEKRPQGQILIDMGAISPHNLEFALERQLELKLYDIFSWFEGKYLFSDRDEHTGTAVAMSLSPAEMVFEGVRRTMSTERVLSELARIEDRIPLPTSEPTFRYQALELNPRAERLLDAIDGKTRLSELMARELLPSEQAAVLLYVLVSTSLLRLLDAPTLGRPSAAPRDVIALGEGDVEALHTGELPVDLPALRAVAEARQIARAARDRALQATTPADEVPELVPSEPPPEGDELAQRPQRPSAVLFASMASVPPPLPGPTPPPLAAGAPPPLRTSVPPPLPGATSALADAPFPGAAAAFLAAPTPAAAAPPDAVAAASPPRPAPARTEIMRVRSTPVQATEVVRARSALASSSDDATVRESVISPPAAAPPPLPLASPPPLPPGAQDDAASALRGSAGVPEHRVDFDTALSVGVDLASDQATQLAEGAIGDDLEDGALVEVEAHDIAAEPTGEAAEAQVTAASDPALDGATAESIDDDAIVAHAAPVADDLLADAEAPAARAPLAAPPAIPAPDEAPVGETPSADLAATDATFAATDATFAATDAPFPTTDATDAPSAATDAPFAAPLEVPPEADEEVDAASFVASEFAAPSPLLGRDEIRARLEASLTAQLAARSPLTERPIADDLALPDADVGPPPPPPAAPPPPRPSALPKGLSLDLDQEKQRRVQELERLHAQLEALDAYALLGVTEDATPDEIAAAFEAKARTHHPDRTASGSAPRDARAAAERVYLLMVRARDTLTHAAERRAYDRLRAPHDDPHRVEARALVAESLFRHGLAQLEAGELSRAFEAFDDATALAPEEGTYLAYLAWTSFMLAPEDSEAVERALADLARATDASPRAEEPHVFAGLIQEKIGRRDESARSFRRALIANPDSVRALRALRALAPPPEKKTGLFSRFGG